MKIHFDIDSQPIIASDTDNHCYLLSKYSKLFDTDRDCATYVINQTNNAIYKHLINILQFGYDEFYRGSPYSYSDSVILFEKICKVLYLADRLNIPKMRCIEEIGLKIHDYYTCFKLLEVLYGERVNLNETSRMQLKENICYSELNPFNEEIKNVLQNNKIACVKNYLNYPFLKDFTAMIVQCSDEYRDYFINNTEIIYCGIFPAVSLKDYSSMWLEFLNHTKSINATLIIEQYVKAFQLVVFHFEKPQKFDKCIIWTLLNQSPVTIDYYQDKIYDIFNKISDLINPLTNEMLFEFYKINFIPTILSLIAKRNMNLFIAIVLACLDKKKEEKMSANTKSMLYELYGLVYGMSCDKIDEMFSIKHKKIQPKFINKSTSIRYSDRITVHDHKILYNYYPFDTSEFDFDNEQDKAYYNEALGVCGKLTKAAVK
jgi:hypothetical protein